jgi:predicted membrane protein
VADNIAMFSAEDSARDAVPEDSELRGMQLAMLQEAAPPALLAEVSQRFQRSWFEAAVVERAADRRCGWPACSAIMQVAKGRAQLLAKLVRL